MDTTVGNRNHTHVVAGFTAIALAGAAILLTAIIVKGCGHSEEPDPVQINLTGKDESAARETQEPARVRPEDEVVDLDRTVNVIHEIDLVLEEATSLEQYISFVNQQDYRGVDPTILEARQEICNAFFGMYQRKTEVDERELMFKVCQAMTLPKTLLHGVRFTGKVGVVPVDMGLDASQAIDALFEEHEDLGDLREDLHELRIELLGVIGRHNAACREVREEWDRLCLLRDHAYLAAYNMHWDATRAAAESAIEMAPLEKEAHLLRALAMIEGDMVPQEGAVEVLEFLDDYMNRHPSSTAPALLLQGVCQARRGEVEAARRLFQQSAVEYPRQAIQLTGLVEPYRLRSQYMRQSNEGNAIQELYFSTMLGACWFSPDLQLAKLEFDTGNWDAGRMKIRDHFARRRAQGQWNLILFDIRFCEDLLGDDYRTIFPEDVYLDLEVEEPWWGGDYELSIENRSDRTLHNATLVLCLKFTDMHPDDYVAIPVSTQTEVLAHDTTSFGEVDVDVELFGVEKSTSDVYSLRAVVVSNEAVSWVDTSDFRTKNAQEAAANLAPTLETLSALTASPLVSMVTNLLFKESSLDIASALVFDDDARVELPRLLAALEPRYTLLYGEDQFAPDSNQIEDGKIVLGFEEVDEFDDDTLPIGLRIESNDSDLELRWIPDGEGGYSLEAAGEGD